MKIDWKGVARFVGLLIASTAITWVLIKVFG